MGQRAPDDLASTTWSEPPHCHFELSAPRHFVYPAILLLLSEKPRHGYRLIDPLIGLGFGPVDRPTVYRALADLERDGLLESWNAEPKAGATRHVYALTEAGRRALHHWMEVLAAERDVLELVLAALRRSSTIIHGSRRLRRPRFWRGRRRRWPRLQRWGGAPGGRGPSRAAGRHRPEGSRHPRGSTFCRTRRRS